MQTSFAGNNIESLKNILNEKLKTYASYYETSKPENGYESMYPIFTKELMNVQGVKEVNFNPGISKSLPPQKSFKIIYEINNKTLIYRGVIVLAAVPRLLSFIQQES